MKKNITQVLEKNGRVDGRVVENYALLVKKTQGQIPTQKGANYKIAPTFGGTKALLKTK